MSLTLGMATCLRARGSTELGAVGSREKAKLCAGSPGELQDPREVGERKGG